MPGREDKRVIIQLIIAWLDPHLFDAGRNTGLVAEKCQQIRQSRTAPVPISSTGVMQPGNGELRWVHLHRLGTRLIQPSLTQGIIAGEYRRCQSNNEYDSCK